MLKTSFNTHFTIQAITVPILLFKPVFPYLKRLGPQNFSTGNAGDSLPQYANGINSLLRIAK